MISGKTEWFYKIQYTAVMVFLTTMGASDTLLALSTVRYHGLVAISSYSVAVVVIVVRAWRYYTELVLVLGRQQVSTILAAFLPVVIFVDSR